VVTDAVAELFELLSRQDANGQLRYSDDDIRELVPFLALGVVREFPGVSLPTYVVEAIGNVAVRAGITEGTPAERVLPALEQFYATNSAPLVEAVRAILHRVGAGAALESARTAAAALGIEASLRPLDSGARPEGTVRGGASARFLALKQTEKK
jgi:hypothetical protein